jgi:pseudaminic acid cytidylyltransferase
MLVTIDRGFRIAVIPARGGSKRIPKKNVRDFCSKPIIGWSIEEAIRSECFDRIIVSTDDLEIAEVAKRYGAEVPFMRPAELSDDHSGTIPVIAHATHWATKHLQAVNDVCCIYATAPFIQAADLRRGLEILEKTDADYALSVTSYAFPIQRAVRVTSNQRIEMFQPEHFNTRSQDLEIAWHDAGQFCWGRARAWLQGKPIFSRGTTPVFLPRYRVQDIDSIEDWHQAELMFNLLSSMEQNTDNVRFA